MIQKAVLFFLISFLYCSVFGQAETDKPVLRNDNHNQSIYFSSAFTSNYDIKYHRLELEINPPVIFIEGHVTTYFVAKSDMNSMYFDFRDNMIVDSVKYDGQSITHSFSTTVELKINFPSTITTGTLDSLTIYYQGTPSSSGGFGDFGSFDNAITNCSDQDTVM